MTLKTHTILIWGYTNDFPHKAPPTQTPLHAHTHFYITHTYLLEAGWCELKTLEWKTEKVSLEL